MVHMVENMYNMVVVVVCGYGGGGGGSSSALKTSATQHSLRIQRSLVLTE
jgi:hypothetical protein